MPASRLLSTGRAARPKTKPAAPAEANKLTPYWRTDSMVINAAATVMIASKVLATRCRIRICVTCLRASRLSSLSVLNRRR